MSANNQKKLSNYNKTLLSVVIISAVTGGLVLLENYRKEQAVAKFTEELIHYKAPEKSYSESLEQHASYNSSESNSFSTTDAEQLAEIAERNLLVGSSITVSTTPERSTVNKIVEETAVKTELIATFTKVDVLFELSSASITPEYKLALSKMAEQIKKQDKNKKWQLIGHTDKSGHVLYNLQLAKKRAQNVANFLIQQGVDEQQLKLVTLGEYEAMQVSNSTYNKGLRKVQVMEYNPEIDTLAATLQKRFERLEQQRINKEQLANIKKMNNGSSIHHKNDEKTAQFLLKSELDENDEKTSIALDSTTGANLLNEQSSNSRVVLGSEPLANNTIEQNEVIDTLSNYDL